MVLIEVLAVALLLTFFTFAGVDYWVVMSKHQYAEHIMHRYLDRMALEGRLSAADEASLVNDFASVGLVVESITGPRESRGDARVLRNPANPDASTVTLRVVARPVPQPLFSGALIRGNVPGPGFRIIVGGEALSERVSP